MSEKPSLPTINQTAIGDGIIQIAGDQNTVYQTVFQRITNFFAFDTEQQRAQRNRRAMLELVKNTWIKGVLEKSLHKEVLIELGLEERPGAVEHPWDMQLQMPDRENCTLPPGASILDVFNDTNEAMLLLGGPGSGKTTMLLELARECIARAEKDTTQPIPVVLNLSSWSNPKQLISDWVVKELATKYFVSTDLAGSWIKHDELLLLLDGLDEVRNEYRNLCVEALNSFRSQHGSTPLLVCSRIADYEALNTRLHLWGAVLLKPLTLQQVNEYFEQIGAQLAEFRQNLQSDEILQELVQQPLMLSVITLAYQGPSKKSLTDEKIKTIDARRDHIFDAYLQQMFERATRTRNELYPTTQTKLWLAWLAYKMLEQRQSIFYLLNLHRGWLTYPQQILLITIYGLIFGCVGSLIVGASSGFDGTVMCLFVPTLLGFIFAPIVVKLNNSSSTGSTNVLKWSWLRARRGFIFGLITGVIAGVGYVVIFSSAYVLIFRDWPDFNARSQVLKILEPNMVIYIFLRLLAGGFMLGFINTLLYGLNKEEVKEKSIPNQGVRQLTKSMLIALLSTTMVFAITCGLFVFAMPLIEDIMFGYFHYRYLIYSIGVGGLIGSIVGLGFGLYYGGFQAIRHCLIRLLLYREGHAPLNYIPFLDYCVDRIFLRRVGGGYIFVHRLLMEHFAAMYSERKS